MRYVLIAVLLILGVFAAFLIAPLRITAEYRRGGVRLTFRSLFLRYTFDPKKSNGRKEKKKDENTDNTSENVKNDAESVQTAENFFEKIEKLKKNYRDFREIFDVFFKTAKYKIRFSDIYIKIHYGSGDAADTGMLYGAVWALVGSVYGFLCRNFYIAFPDLELVPDFDKKVFEAEAEGIITARPVHIIIALIRVGLLYMKKKKQKD